MTAAPSVRSWIERVEVDRYFGNTLDRVKELQRKGWTLTVLIAPDKKTVVILGFRHGFKSYQP